jgi:pilus assembly protein Flp/PilA
MKGKKVKKIYWSMKERIANLGKSEEAVTAVEYGLIAAATAVVIIAALTTIKTDLKAIFDAIAAAL